MNEYNNMICMLAIVVVMVMLERIVYWTKRYNTNKRKKEHDETVKRMRMAYHIKQGGTR